MDINITPANQDLSEAVAKPRPNSLSKHAHNITKEIENLNRFQRVFSDKSFIETLYLNPNVT